MILKGLKVHNNNFMIKFSLTIPSYVLFHPVNVTGALPYSLMSSLSDIRVVWGLHCAMDDGDLFFNKLNLGYLVDKLGFAFIAPSLWNFYFINSRYERQADFLHNEFFPTLQSLLPLSRERKNNMLLGISMGAFGAAHWALSNPESFGASAMISGSFDASIPVNPLAKKNRELRPLVKLFSDRLEPLLMKDEYGNISLDADIRPLYDKAAEKGAPKFGLWYGEDDYLCLIENRDFIANCRSRGISVEEFCSPGSHNIEFWQKAVDEAVHWLLD